MTELTPFALLPVFQQMEMICQQVSDKHRVDALSIRGPRRLGPLVKARYEAIWRIRTEAGASLNTIARYFGGRDHTTIMYAIDTHASRLERAARLEQSP